MYLGQPFWWSAFSRMDHFSVKEFYGQKFCCKDTFRSGLWTFRIFFGQGFLRSDILLKSPFPVEDIYRLKTFTGQKVFYSQKFCCKDTFRSGLWTFRIFFGQGFLRSDILLKSPFPVEDIYRLKTFTGQKVFYSQKFCCKDTFRSGLWTFRIFFGQGILRVDFPALVPPAGSSTNH